MLLVVDILTRLWGKDLGAATPAYPTRGRSRAGFRLLKTLDYHTIAMDDEGSPPKSESPS